jgi:hypothetical protein
MNVFVYELGLNEQDLSKHAKIDSLSLTDTEWLYTGQFADPLLVRRFFLV